MVQVDINRAREANREATINILDCKVWTFVSLLLLSRRLRGTSKLAEREDSTIGFFDVNTDRIH